MLISLAGRSGLVVSASVRFESHRRTIVLIATATAKYSLGHGLRTSTAVPCIHPGSLNRVAASVRVKASMSPLTGGR